MTMNLVGQQKLFEVPSSMKNMDEDIVYSVIERYSRKASEPTTTRSITTSSLILDYLEGTLALLGSLFIIKGVFVLDTKLKHLQFSLDNESYRVNVFVVIIPNSMIVNGTGRLEYLISIPEWNWSISVAKENCPKFYWQDSLKSKIDKSLEKYTRKYQIH